MGGLGIWGVHVHPLGVTNSPIAFAQHFPGGYWGSCWPLGGGWDRLCENSLFLHTRSMAELDNKETRGTWWSWKWRNQEHGCQNLHLQVARVAREGAEGS